MHQAQNQWQVKQIQILHFLLKSCEAQPKPPLLDPNWDGAGTNTKKSSKITIHGQHFKSFISLIPFSLWKLILNLKTFVRNSYMTVLLDTKNGSFIDLTISGLEDAETVVHKGSTWSHSNLKWEFISFVFLAFLLVLQTTDYIYLEFGRCARFGAFW